MSESQRPNDFVIVGGGMVGLTLALRLAEAGRRVTVLEADSRLGGLVSPWELAAPDMPGGTLSWDRFYHVTLASDTALRALLRQLDLDDEIEWGTTRTGVAAAGRQYPVSSPRELMSLTPLPLMARLRLGLTVLRASRVRDVDRLEHVPVEQWLRRYSGRRAFELFWRPQLRAKLGDAYADASAAFIAVTAQRLLRARRAGLAEERFGYVPGGYERVVTAFEKHLRELGVQFEVGVRVDRVAPVEAIAGVVSGVDLTVDGGRLISADHVVLTVPSTLIATMVPSLEKRERDLLRRQRYLGVTCVSLVLREPLSPYYLTYLLDDSLLTGVVDMTSLVPPERLGGHGLVYLPRYQDPADPVFDWPDAEIIERFVGDLQRAYPQFDRASIVSARVASVRSVFTMPAVGYLANVVPQTTSVPGISIVNGSQIIHGTLNVDESVTLANAASAALLATSLGSRRDEPFASLSLDLDNEWSYLMVRGAPTWKSYPTYLPTFLPRALREFTAAGLRLTFFVVGVDATHDANKEPIAAIAAAGHEIGNHSFGHEPWLHRYSYDELSHEFERAEDAIRTVTGVQTVGFRGPGYSLSPDVLRVLCARGYRYDASTLPTVIGPVARAFYVRSANLSAQQRQERKFLFGSFRDGFRSLRPYSWSIPDGDGASIPEIPVTTLPLLRIPIHVSYLLYIAEHSVPLALRYFDTALRLCDIRRVQPSLLLHPLDFLGGDDVPSLSFFPAMSMPSNEKSAFVMRVLDRLQRRYEVVTLAEHLDRITVFEAPRKFHSPKRADR